MIRRPLGTSASLSLLMFSLSLAPLPVYKHDDHVFPVCIFFHFFL